MALGHAQRLPVRSFASGKLSPVNIALSPDRIVRRVLLAVQIGEGTALPSAALVAVCRGGFTQSTSRTNAAATEGSQSRALEWPLGRPTVDSYRFPPSISSAAPDRGTFQK